MRTIFAHGLKQLGDLVHVNNVQIGFAPRSRQHDCTLGSTKLSVLPSPPDKTFLINKKKFILISYPGPEDFAPSLPQ